MKLSLLFYKYSMEFFRSLLAESVDIFRLKIFLARGFPGNKCVEHHAQFTEPGPVTRSSLPTLGHQVIAAGEC